MVTFNQFNTIRQGLAFVKSWHHTSATAALKHPQLQLFANDDGVEAWGRHQHELHSRVTPERAAECGLPIFRVASSGISQAVPGGGQVVAQTARPGNREILSAHLRLPQQISIPLDRYLAPLCVGITRIVTAVSLPLAWKDKRRAGKISATD